MRTATTLLFFLLAWVGAQVVPTRDVVSGARAVEQQQVIYDRALGAVDVLRPPAFKGTSTTASSSAAPSATITPCALRVHRRQAQSNASTTTTSNVSIPVTAAAGGLSYIQPAATDAVSYYKIASGQLITFAWTYTSLYVTPRSLTFEARCTANSFTYPVGPTTGIPASQTSLVWDPYAYAQSAGAIPFAQASYTLRVYDERGINAAATGGYFNGAQSVAYFALYSPAPYTPLASGWKCVTCSAAMVSKHLSHPVLIALPVTMALVLIGGAGILYR
ncbi:BQ2448_3834 [Microbotryum intermedium]|uniref:BQ2448_3834 protein n=1 Tax=Microbotryum intermedium TaxID=269621 RepID=A0A238FB46_9BASI|nr:BQ2448_3834 [Microbotryum intermedium]